MANKNKGSDQHFRLCVPPCPCCITRWDAYDLCVACLEMEHAWSAFKGADCVDCECLPLQTICSYKTLFEKGAQAFNPRCSGSVAAGAQQRLRLWGSLMELAEGLATDSVLSLPSPARSSGLSQESEAHSVVSSPPNESQTLHLSSSEMDVVRVDAE